MKRLLLLILVIVMAVGCSAPPGDQPPAPAVASTSLPTETPKPTKIPTDTKTPEPTETPQPTDTPKLAGPVAPIIVPESTNTPQDTPTPELTAIEAPPTMTLAPIKVHIYTECSQVDPPGNDNDILDQEWICLQNRGEQAVDLEGWKAIDDKDHTYTFHAFTLEPGATVKLHTGEGENGPEDVYWNQSGSAVWNNSGDTVKLFDSSGMMVDSWSY